MKLLLTQCLDFYSADTKVNLFLNSAYVGSSYIYDFPHRHEMNKYYGNNVNLIKSVGKDNIDIFID